MAKSIGILIVILVSIASLPDSAAGQGQDMQAQEREQILKFLARFQEGYARRDVARVSAWVSELMTEDVYVMGTNAVYPGTGEWQVGRERAEELFANDWKSWGVLKADIDNADVRLLSQSAAMVALTATVTKSPDNGFGRSNEENLERSLARLAALQKTSDKTIKQRLFTAIWDAGMVLKHTELGDTFVWPIRISMVLIKVEGRWKMTQTHFSYPMTGYPPVRIIDGKVVGY